MRVRWLKQIAIGFAPSILGALAVALNALFPSRSPGRLLLIVVYIFGIACSFRGGFGVADQFVRSPLRNLLLGLLFTVLFLALNVGALMVALACISPHVD